MHTCTFALLHLTQEAQLAIAAASADARGAVEEAEEQAAQARAALDSAEARARELAERLKTIKAQVCVLV